MAAPLPRWQARLAGRGGELAELRRLLAGSRLVTVTGPGGVGKTRLAAQVAAGLVGRFPGGVLFAGLAPVCEVEHVVPALAGVLAAEGTGGPVHLASIAERLGGAAALLMLDNCEHLIEESAAGAGAGRASARLVNSGRRWFRRRGPGCLPGVFAARAMPRRRRMPRAGPGRVDLAPDPRTRRVSRRRAGRVWLL